MQVNDAEDDTQILYSIIIFIIIFSILSCNMRFYTFSVSVKLLRVIATGKTYFKIITFKILHRIADISPMMSFYGFQIIYNFSQFFRNYISKSQGISDWIWEKIFVLFRESNLVNTDYQSRMNLPEVLFTRSRQCCKYQHSLVYLNHFQ